MEKFSKNKKEDLGLLMHMQQADRTDFVSREEIMSALETDAIVPNNETVLAMKNLKDGKGINFGSVDELFKSI